MGARETALNVLITCRKQGGWADGVLKQTAQRDRLDRREAALAAQLCYGVLQNRALLDFYLQQLLHGRVKDLHPAARDILHLGLYQLYQLDKIPASAAVNESVALAKKYCRKQPGAAGLVNGVLRNAVRSRGTLREPDRLDIRYSHPQKLVALLEAYVGRERLEPMLAANNAIPHTVIQVNTLRTTTDALRTALAEAGITARPHGWMPDCLILSGTGNLEQLPAYREGLLYVQDAAARLSVLCAQPPKGGRVLDCCGAPGGKTFAAAIAMGGVGEIIACDIHEHKLPLIRKGASRLGLSGIQTRRQDAAVRCPAWLGAMDVVLADVPCSGYGIIRKKPDIRYKDPQTMEELPELQLNILRNQADYVKPGGILLYSTCTLLRRENEGVVEAFLRERPDFAPETLPLPEELREDSPGMLRLIPGEHDTDGFFICRMRRRV